MVTVFAALLVVLIGRAGQPSNPIGMYTCTGTQAGVPYHMSLVVTAFGQGYDFIWSVQEGSAPTVVGVAVPDGDHLAIALLSRNGGVGAAHYVVSPGRLEGRWTRGDGSIDRESCLVKGKAA